MEVIMHVVDWDSYLVQWGDLLQHLIGHVDVDADLSSKRVAHGSRSRIFAAPPPSRESSSKWNESHDRT